MSSPPGLPPLGGSPPGRRTQVAEALAERRGETAGTASADSPPPESGGSISAAQFWERVNQLNESDKENKKHIEVMWKNLKEKDKAIKNLENEMKQQDKMIKEIQGDKKHQSHILKALEGMVSSSYEDIRDQIGHFAAAESRLLEMFHDYTIRELKEVKEMVNEMKDAKRDLESYRTRYEEVATVTREMTPIART